MSYKNNFFKKNRLFLNRLKYSKCPILGCLGNVTQMLWQPYATCDSCKFVIGIKKFKKYNTEV